MAHERDIEAGSVAEAYVMALELLLRLPDRSAVHLVARVADPTADDPAITDLVDGLLVAYGQRSVNTVVNTLFPTSLAERYVDPCVLVARYREHYGRIRRLNGNSDTYFGRLVAYPVAGEEPMDQLGQLVEKLRHARRSGRTMTSRYEVAITALGDSVLVYSAERDCRKPRGFPCLSFLSFHVAGGMLHLAAHYRNHAFVARAYGNYLALGRLLAYVAAATDWGIGELLVLSGHAQIDLAGKRRMQGLIADARTQLAPPEAGPRETAHAP